MSSPEIQRLVDAVEEAHGQVELYGSSPSEEHGTCFKIARVPATFSVITLEGTLPSGTYDIQIEGSPPGDYLFTAQVSLEGFLKLVAQMCRSEDEWPGISPQAS